MSKKITCDYSVKDQISKAFQLIAEPVGSTLGPGGRNVLMRNMGGAPTLTKDGVTVANSISVEDPELDLIISIIKEAADKTNREAGDGTTTATVLASLIYKAGQVLLSSGYKATALQREILVGLNKIANEVERRSIPVGDSLDILEKIASVSMNGDKEVAKLVAEAVHSVGVNGSVTVQGARTTQSKWWKEEGVRINRGWASPAFCSDSNSNKVVFENPYILITSYDLQGPGQLQDLANALQPLVESRRPLVIISSGIGSSFMASLIMNSKNGTLLTCPILPPYFGNVRREFFRDLSALTGARVIDHGEGDQLAAVKIEHLGQAAKIEITSSETVIIGGKGDPSKIEARKEYLRSRLGNDGVQDLDKVKERLAKLSGGIGIIEMTYLSDVEFQEKKHRVEDAACACRAAMESGYVPGGGATLYSSAAKIVNPDSPGEMVLLASIEDLVRKIASNASKSAEIIIEKMKDSSTWDEKLAYDVESGKAKDALEAGIIDPVKVVKTALMNGGSIAAALLTTGAIISDLPQKANNSFLEPYMPT
jgi:chaperonin GroEL